MALEAFGDLLGKRHLFACFQKRRNNQQALEGALGWLVLESSKIAGGGICAA
jgi:hypothetical protein